MANNIVVGIAIPFRNRFERTRTVLNNIERMRIYSANHGIDTKLVLLNDDSDEGPPEYVTRDLTLPFTLMNSSFTKDKYLEFLWHRGTEDNVEAKRYSFERVGDAKREAVGIAYGLDVDYVFLNDSDQAFERTALVKLIEFLDSGKLCVCPLIRTSTNPLVFNFTAWDEEIANYRRGEPFYKRYPWFPEIPSEPFEVDHAAGVHLFDVALFNKVPLEQLFIGNDFKNWGEDHEFSKVLRRVGIQNWIYPNIKSVHYMHPNPARGLVWNPDDQKKILFRDQDPRVAYELVAECAPDSEYKWCPTTGIFDEVR